MTLLFAILFAILPPCPTEDSTMCRWDAGGSGVSFVALSDGTAHLLIYADGTAQIFD